jgi:hypothetical protein
MADRRQEPSLVEVEAAAQALVEWQFPTREQPWESLPEGMKDKFREAARRALNAASKAEAARRLAVS